jgi:O-methyltransferase
MACRSPAHFDLELRIRMNAMATARAAQSPSRPAKAREWLRQRLSVLRSRLVSEPYRTVLPYTMVGLERLRVLNELAHRIDELNLPGDVVECGACNGGSGAILARVAADSPRGRHVWLLDAFEGMPQPSDRDGTAARAWVGTCRGSIERVREVLARCGVEPDRVTLVAGWFEQTLPTLAVEQIALLHVDADWYESVKTVLEALYDKVVPGGFVVFDDYGYWQGCRTACDEFFAARQVQVDLIRVDGIGVYMQKPA